MRAVQLTGYGTPDVVEVTEVAAPRAGAGQIRVAVRASGLSTGEVRLRSGALKDVVPLESPYRTGFDAAGVVDEVGAGVTGVSPGDEVFGLVSAVTRGANADLAVLEAWAPRPSGWTWAEAGGAGGSVETAVRVLDRMRVDACATVLVQGAPGAAGTVVAQVALARGAMVIGTASAANQEFVRSLGATPTEYGAGLVDRIQALAPAGVDVVIDCAGAGLPDLVTIAGDSTNVLTIADPQAVELGVQFSYSAPGADRGDTGTPHADALAVHALPLAASLADAGRLRIPIAAALSLSDAAVAHRLSESRHPPGRIVLTH